MRILILANNDVGLYKFRKELIETLIGQGHEICISLPGGDMVRPFEEVGCKFIETNVDRRGINPKTDFGLFRKYQKIIKTEDPELIIAYTIKPNIYGGIASRLAKKKYAVNITGLGTAFEKGGMVKRIVIALYKIALKKADVVFFENSGNKDVLVSCGCCKEDKTMVLNGAGVNTEYYSYMPYPENQKVKFLFVGRVMQEKGVDELFAAMEKLIADGENCFLDVVGPFEENYADKLKQFEKEGWLKYHGFQKDVRSFIGACDCFVLPSYHEGMANTNLESASSGRPIITSDIPGCKEAVVDCESGYLCKPKDVESLYQAMKKMIDRTDREQMGRAGRALMENKFKKEIVIKETLKGLKID